jgi:predicted acetyltransferase
VTIDVRVTRPDEYRAAAEAFCIALMTAPPNDEQWERSRPSWDEMPSMSAWDGDGCVGHAGQFLVDTTVPGGVRLPTGAVSRVGVLTSHRRRGVATRLMEALIADADERGLALMSLRASETTIYERYGFGMAGDACEAELIPDRARPIRGATSGSFRIVDPDDILVTVMPLYERFAHRRPGCITRPASFWRRLFRGAIERSSATFVAVHTGDDGDDDGYVLYETKWVDDGIVEGGVGEVHELIGADDGAELALWSYICDIDLVHRWKLQQRPVDDLVRRAARDQRAYRRQTVADEQWLRIIDVELALAVRSYQPIDGSIVVQVTDPLVPGNDGTWHISSAGAMRTHEPPRLTTGIAGLSMVYLGGPTWSEAAAIGLVEVHDGEALDTADALFASRPLPFCGTFF